MAIPVLQLGPGGDYTTQYHAKDGNLTLVSPTNESMSEDRSAGQFARKRQQPRKRPPQTISVHPAASGIVRQADSYQPSQPNRAGTYCRPVMQQAASPKTMLDQLMQLDPAQQQQVLNMLGNALNQTQAASPEAPEAQAMNNMDASADMPQTQVSPIHTIEDTERQRAIAHVLEDLRQLRHLTNSTSSAHPSSTPEVNYETPALTESDTQATGHRPSHSPVSPSKGLFSDDAGTGRRP
jgi:hypothetical protein